MPRGAYVVLTEPVDGREAEYNDWYDNVHLAEVCRVPGVVAARRYLLGDPQPFGRSVSGARRYLAIYDLDCADLLSCIEELGRRAASGEMAMSTSLTLDPAPDAKVYTEFSRVSP